ncbi:MAG: type II toxin-antitoxin system VapC family toxin [Candidatus Rokubacteria bacterium]|nr:type II toxin-antitoxin system VapC family toxin [Candidatus Rokubacteria bacterium]
MVNAERVYADPSALLKLYIHEPESAAMSRWRARTRAALPISPQGRLEIVNGIGLAAFRSAITNEASRDALASFEEDFAEGRYVEIDVPWRATLRRAIEISRLHTPKFGARSLDVLHVATALELGLRRFVTFDRRQQHLARATGLAATRPTV